MCVTFNSFYKCGSKVDNIGSKVDFPEEWLNFENNLINSSGLPTILIVNAQVPTLHISVI
jgi:hypothetical protein